MLYIISQLWTYAEWIIICIAWDKHSYLSACLCSYLLFRMNIGNQFAMHNP